jgi:hypothetical protein
MLTSPVIVQTTYQALAWRIQHLHAAYCRISMNFALFSPMTGFQKPNFWYLIFLNTSVAQQSSSTCHIWYRIIVYRATCRYSWFYYSSITLDWWPDSFMITACSYQTKLVHVIFMISEILTVTLIGTRTICLFNKSLLVRPQRNKRYNMSVIRVHSDTNDETTSEIVQL